MVPPPDSYWHTIPLHLLPTLLREGSLRASAYPRPRVYARRRKLGLASYLHFSLTPKTPLLTDKRAHGYPHALLAFRLEIAQLPGAGFCRYNQKAWRHREDFALLADATEKALFLELYQQGRYPSAELLVPHTLSLDHATGLFFASQAEADWLARFPLPTPPTTVAPETFPPAPEIDFAALDAYAAACQAAGTVLPPPDLPFD